MSVWPIVAVLVASCSSGTTTTTDRLETTITSESPTTSTAIVPNTSTTTTVSATTTIVPATTTTLDDPPELRPDGLDRLSIGMSEPEAAATGMIGEIEPGCEITSARQARLSDPALDGFVEFFDGELARINVREGATTAEGIEIGSSLEDVTATYGEDGTDIFDATPTFDVLMVTVIRADGGTYMFAVDPGSEQVVVMAAPELSGCE